MAFGARHPTIGISVTGSNKSLAIPVGAAQCCIVNTGAVAVFAQFGIGSATAVIPTADSATGTQCYPVPASDSRIVDVPAGANYVACIGAGAGPSLTYFTLGGEV
jgi:hypothetical protein